MVNIGNVVRYSACISCARVDMILSGIVCSWYCNAGQLTLLSILYLAFLLTISVSKFMLNKVDDK